MDSYREHPNDFGPVSEPEVSASAEVSNDIGTDERRMHVRAYNYWVSLLDGREYPSIEDLEPGEVEDFAANSVLLDFTSGRDNPATPYIGAAVREECGLDEGIKSIDQVPSRSLLSRLTDHYLQIIANRAPIGFEAEFENQRGQSICYRGILMPFSSDGDTIDFIYGVINWKQQKFAAPVLVAEPAFEDDQEDTEELILGDEDQSEDQTVVEVAHELDDELVLEDEMMPTALNDESDVLELTQDEAGEGQAADEAPAEDPFKVITPTVHFSWEDGPLAT